MIGRKRVLAIAVGALLVAGPAAAQTVTVHCTFPDTDGGLLVHIDYGSRIVDIDAIDRAGGVAQTGYRRMPAQITEDQIVAIWRQGGSWQRYTLNRRTGIMVNDGNMGGGAHHAVSNPCQRYQKPPQKF